MIKVSIHQAKTHLSKYLAKLKKGEIILICNRNVPIAELKPIQSPSIKPRPIGLAKDKFSIPDSFCEPLPQNFLLHFDTQKK